MNTRFLYTLLVCCVVATSGCKSFDINGDETSASKDEGPWWKKKDDLPPVAPAAKIVAIWSNSVLNESGALPVRGLGGRVYFYDAKHKPVRVDGKLTVFLYDDTQKSEGEEQEATRKVHFSPEEVAEKYTPTEFGPSYSFWVPWDAVGGERVQLSVIPVFTSVGGEMLVGEQAKYLLPGKKPVQIADNKPQQGVVPASFVEGATEATGRKLQLKSSTIKVPRSVQRRLLAPSNPTANSSKKVDPVTSQRTKQVQPRVSDVQRTTLSRSRNSRKGFDRYERRLSGFPTTSGSITRLNQGTSNATESNSGQTIASVEESAGYQLDPRQVQDLQSLQQAAVRDQNVLDRAKQLFSHSQQR